MKPLDYLYSLELHGIKLGLENIGRLLAEAANPQHKYPTLHVAGSNGKGSVVAILDAIFRKAGYRVGRFTSPHLCSVRERFLVNGEMISDSDLDRWIETFRKHGEALGNPPTFFELNTAIAFGYFAEKNVDVALIEVGLGGRFDSTNVITPVVSGITTIALEHTQFLGDTLELIAFEKAGIIKAGVPVVVGGMQQGPQQVIEERAAELSSAVLLLNREFTHEHQSVGGHEFVAYRGVEWEIALSSFSLPGEYQGANAAVAIAMAEQARDRFPQLSEEVVREALKDVRWPCRLERVLDSPTVIIDVAHNAAGIGELVRAVDRPCTVVFAAASDKNVTAMLEALQPIATRLIVTEFEGRRAVPYLELEAMATGKSTQATPSVESALELAFQETPVDGTIIVTGSLFIAGEAREILVRKWGAPEMAF